jgi:hypothetical protein
MLRGLIQVSVDIDPDGSWIMLYKPNDVDEPDDYERFGSAPSDETRLIGG